MLKLFRLIFPKADLVIDNGMTNSYYASQLRI